jgi:hypothetical protein
MGGIAYGRAVGSGVGRLLCIGPGQKLCSIRRPR